MDAWINWSWLIRVTKQNKRYRQGFWQKGHNLKFITRNSWNLRQVYIPHTHLAWYSPAIDDFTVKCGVWTFKPSKQFCSNHDLFYEFKGTGINEGRMHLNEGNLQTIGVGLPIPWLNLKKTNKYIYWAV